MIASNEKDLLGVGRETVGLVNQEHIAVFEFAETATDCRQALYQFPPGAGKTRLRIPRRWPPTWSTYPSPKALRATSRCKRPRRLGTRNQAAGTCPDDTALAYELVKSSGWSSHFPIYREFGPEPPARRSRQWRLQGRMVRRISIGSGKAGRFLSANGHFHHGHAEMKG